VHLRTEEQNCFTLSFILMHGKTNKRKSPVKPYSTNVRDYPSLLSGFEKESLAAEAQLAADRKAKRRPTPMKPKV